MRDIIGGMPAGLLSMGAPNGVHTHADQRQEARTGKRQVRWLGNRSLDRRKRQIVHSEGTAARVTRQCNTRYSTRGGQLKQLVRRMTGTHRVAAERRTGRIYNSIESIESRDIQGHRIGKETV